MISLKALRRWDGDAAQATKGSPMSSNVGRSLSFYRQTSRASRVPRCTGEEDIEAPYRRPDLSDTRSARDDNQDPSKAKALPLPPLQCAGEMSKQGGPDLLTLIKRRCESSFRMFTVGDTGGAGHRSYYVCRLRGLYIERSGKAYVYTYRDRGRKTRPNRIVTARRLAKVPPFTPLPADPRNPPGSSRNGGGTYQGGRKTADVLGRGEGGELFFIFLCQRVDWEPQPAAPRQQTSLLSQGWQWRNGPCREQAAASVGWQAQQGTPHRAGTDSRGRPFECERKLGRSFRGRLLWSSTKAAEVERERRTSTCVPGTKTSDRRQHPDRHWKQRPGRVVSVLTSVDCSSAATPTAAVVNVAVPRNHRRPRTTSTTRDQREGVAVSTSSLVFPVDRSVL
ncbi:hypothetical protein HPB50_011487 [Hyalomma asiaticum]|uniref:Uncharacterized protein n=1 Tax=Hyalomma asiaticum TaxID=266040 RepID=A0ACB7RTT3_HYAAI|nr:hypothetical protein HPB50_011487 [Hyalomma asiaticum]